MLRYLFAAVLFCSALAQADIKAENAWARATLPGQSVGGVFLTLQSDRAATLMRAKCDCAQRVEIHQTFEENGVARMRQQKTVVLPPAKTVEFKAGGLHIMLLGLKSPLKAGEQHHLTLSVQQGPKRTDVTVPFTVKAVNAGSGDEHAHHHH